MGTHVRIKDFKIKKTIKIKHSLVWGPVDSNRDVCSAYLL